MKEKLRELQLAELNMLKDVVLFCEENRIQYFLFAGSLLGAARHGGFIPWDDDIDICMDVVNYRKFLKLGIKGLGEKYFIQNYRTDRKAYYPWIQIRMNGTTSVERHMLNYDIHHGICMDVFVISQRAEGRFARTIQQFATSMMTILIEKHLYEFTGNKQTVKRKLVNSIIPEAFRIPLLRMLERFSYIKLRNAKECFNMEKMNLKNPVAYPIEIMDMQRRTKIRFEDSEFWTFGDWEQYLQIAYGDWRQFPPEDKRCGHGDLIIDLNKDYREYQLGNKSQKQ